MLRLRQKIPFDFPALQKFPSNLPTRSRICAEKPRMPLPGPYQSVRKAGFSSENLEWVKIPAGPPADFKPFHESPHILPLGAAKRVKKRPLCPCKTTDGYCAILFSPERWAAARTPVSFPGRQLISRKQELFPSGLDIGLIERPLQIGEVRNLI